MVWPISSVNTVLNICPQAERMVVERLGKFHSVEAPGWFLSVPGIDSIRFRVDMRERALELTPQAAITKDNVSVHVNGNVYVQFVDAYKAAYGCEDPLYAVVQHAQSSMRAAIGELELDEILHARSKLNELIRGSVQDAAKAWGMDIKRYEITEISPDAIITQAMDKQAVAERTRRELVLRAEGEKRQAELQSEGFKIRLSNESEGDLIRVRNEAEGIKTQLIMEAEAEAEVIRLKANATAEAVRTIAKALLENGGTDAAQLDIAKEYIRMYGEIGQRSNTMFFSDKPADMNTLLAQAASVLKTAGNVASGEASADNAGASAAASAAATAGSGSQVQGTNVTQVDQIRTIDRLRELTQQQQNQKTHHLHDEP